MKITMLKAKIHQATVTNANLYYVGSITIDEEIMDKVGLFSYEKVQVVNINNGARIETYIIAGQRGKKDFCLNGAAARLFHKGDKIIVMSYCEIENCLAPTHIPRIAILDDNNIQKIVINEAANTTIETMHCHE